ncbi:MULTISPECIES: DUF982 domain-containing protein [unclassified Mesorhizobium]|uniref:DUF982 domain-containing protein n=1 Tax=unclassified Mesorhizobium TaxID=325217 RepID=UPI0029817455|nr:MULTISPECIES: DUF982 domain-containing protein [unclassified Mesorhizobium]
MIAARMRECLRLLRWSESDFAEEVGYPVATARNWLWARERPPLGVVAWLEALVKAHRSLPRPSMPATPANRRADAMSATGMSAAPEIRTVPAIEPGPIPGNGPTFDPGMETVEPRKESVMDRSSFEKPVTILTGLGTPTKIESAAQAHALLADWPAASRTAAHDIAAKACRAAMDGEIDAETARATFVAFARRNDLLVPQTNGAIASGTIAGCTTRSQHVNASA